MSVFIQRCRIASIGTLLIILILTISIGIRLAQAAKPAPAANQSENAPLGWGDGDSKEVGVEWINDFPDIGDDRDAWDESCDGLYNRLTGLGWTGRFRWSNWDAWKSDFVRAASGGEEDTYVDSVDIAMICTHGASSWDSYWNQSLSTVYFGSSVPDQFLMPGDAYKSYGDKDLEWLAFDSCSVLGDGGPAPSYNRGYWSSTMNGLHLLLGFTNTMYVNAPGDGYYWGLLMNPATHWIPSQTVTQAWFKAVDYNQPNIVCARVLAQVADNYNDYLHGKGYVSPDPIAGSKYKYWDHCSSNPSQLKQLFENQPDSPFVSVPIFQVQPRIVNEDYVRNQISTAFFDGGYDGQIDEDDLFYYIGDASQGVTVTIQVAKASGGFNFQNLSKLWKPPIVPPDLPDQQTALTLVEDWFKTPAEALPGVEYRYNPQYMLESIHEDYLPDYQGAQGEISTPLASTPADVDVTFTRIVSGLAVSKKGTQMADFLVVGPGSFLRVYLGDGGEVIGAHGGTRDVIPNGMVELLDSAQAWALFLANRSIALPEVPIPADTITYSGVGFAYYEQPITQHQLELIPVYYYNSNFYKKGELIAENVIVYVPAAMKYMPPMVTIFEPIQGSRFSPGQSIYFNGDATGGIPPYHFVWTSDHDGILANSADTDAVLSTSSKEGKLFSHIITLQVTDANGMRGSASTEVYVNALNRLPILINRR